jgi:hypothetical protein
METGPLSAVIMTYFRTWPKIFDSRPRSPLSRGKRLNSV